MRNNEPLAGVSYSDIKRALPIAGAVLVLFGLVRRSPLGFLMALLGGGLIYQAVREATGKEVDWKVFEKGMPTLRSIPHGAGIRIEKSVTVQRSPEDLYRFWRDLSNLPHVMQYLESVTVLDSVHSHWVAKAPAGMKVEWDAEIVNDIENELIGWRSVAGADVSNAGSVHFTPAPSGRGTIVRVNLKYDPPAGKLGAAVAKLFGTDPDQTVEQDLRLFKQLMESNRSDLPSGMVDEGYGATGMSGMSS